MNMNEVCFDGYLAELITLQAERQNMTAEEYVIFLTTGAMHLATKRTRKRSDNFLTTGAMHPQGKQRKTTI